MVWRISCGDDFNTVVISALSAPSLTFSVKQGQRPDIRSLPDAVTVSVQTDAKSASVAVAASEGSLSHPARRNPAVSATRDVNPRADRPAE